MRTITEITSQYDFSGLTSDERSLLGEYLCANSHNDDDFQMTQELKDELDRRLEAYRSGKMCSSSWEDVKNRLYQAIQ
jgi:putative addiction module component (TIGR02574 family)